MHAKDKNCVNVKRNNVLRDTAHNRDCSTSSGERCEYNMMDMEIKKEYCIPKKVDLGYCNGFCTSTSSFATSFANVTR